MKVSVFSVLSIALFAACVYDPPNPGPSYVYNCSDEAIYVYHKLDGQLDMKAPLVLFEEKKENSCLTILDVKVYLGRQVIVLTHMKKRSFNRIFS
jgi:hypothetical protein